MESKKISETFTASSKTVVRQQTSTTTVASSNQTMKDVESEGTPPPRPPPPKYGEVAYGDDHVQADCGPVKIVRPIAGRCTIIVSGEKRARRVRSRANLGSFKKAVDSANSVQPGTQQYNDGRKGKEKSSN